MGTLNAARQRNNIAKSTTNLLSIYFNNFPYSNSNDNIDTLKSFFQKFPFVLKQKQIHVDYPQFYSTLFEKIQIDEETLKKENPNLNIWSGIGIGKSELKHCQFLTWLFTPLAEHKQRNLFLNCFLEELGLDHIKKFTDNKLYTVTREEYSSDMGRVDISIGNNSFWLIIEAKIDAGDQNQQIDRYRTLLNRKNRSLNTANDNYKLIYLTPGKKQSSSGSADIYIDWKQISNTAKMFSEKCQNKLLSDIVNQYSLFISTFN